MGGRAEGSTESGGGSVAVENLSSAAYILGVPANELVATGDWTQEATGALDVGGTRGAAGSAEAAKRSIH